MGNFLYGFLLILVLAVAKIRAQCKGEVDIVVAVPGSADVPQFEFDEFETELTELLRHFKINRRNFNIGLVLYGKTQIRVASPQPFKTRKELNTRITLLHRRNKYSQELNLESNVAGAIYAVHLMLLNPPTDYPREILRPNSRKIGIIFTYGPGNVNDQATNQINIVAAAEAAHRDGILMYALSANGTVPGFSNIGSDKCRLFSMGLYSQSLARAVPDLASSICSEVDPKVPTTPGNCYPKHYGKENIIRVSCIGDSIILPDPNNCAYYFRCDFRKPKRHECATDTLYDTNAKTCNFNQFVECYSDVTCPAPFGLFPHPFDCGRYINCYINIPYIQKCATGSLFDAIHENCNLASRVNCQNRGMFVP